MPRSGILFFVIMLLTRSLLSRSLATTRSTPRLLRTIKTRWSQNHVGFSSRRASALSFDTDDLPISAPTSFRTPVTIIRTPEQAQLAMKTIMAYPTAVWACDTEVVDIDLKEQGPIGNGRVICASVYGGDHINFGTGSTLWIENSGDGSQALQYFKEFFENKNIMKVWHNYGFDRHVLANEGINCLGFYGDTMHMARLWDTSRDKMSVGGGSGAGYSLASLTESFFRTDTRFVKTSMIDLFGVAKLKKDGTESKKKELPDLLHLQQSPEFRDNWIEYSARDALATWHVCMSLEEKLKHMPWMIEDPKTGRPSTVGNLLDFYHKYMRDFGELLTDMERNGIKVDTEHHLKQAEAAARAERAKMETTFREWAEDMCGPEAKHVNLASTVQIQQMLFGHFEGFEKISDTRTFEVDKSSEELAEETAKVLGENPYALLGVAELKQKLKEKGLKQSGKRSELLHRLLHGEDQTAAPGAAPVAYSKMKVGELREACLDRRLPLLLPEVVETAASKKRKAAAAPETEEERRLAVLKKHTKEEMASMLETDDLHRQPVDVLQRQLADDWFLVYSARTAGASEAAEDEQRHRARLLQLRFEVEQHFKALKQAGPDATGAPEPWEAALTAEGRLRRRAAVQVSTAASDVYADLSDSTSDASSTTSSTVPEEAQPVTGIRKKREFSLRTLGLQPSDFTNTGVPQVSAAVLKKLAGKNLFGDESEAVYGTAFEFFGGGATGRRACQALGALAAIGQVDATINNFLVPLQALVDRDSRIHCSLNLNTETGRLSSRRPNLQNQPALEKDPYKIRDAFVADPSLDHTLIVADYGQLELRILAHITNCASMIAAFRDGGCFHSRTAVGMYPHIQEAVASGQVLLEWDHSKGQAPVPLVKDKFASERRKAKTLNFSIAYGKTVHGLAADWGISKEEAEKTLEAWYSDRPEVKRWQLDTQALARKSGFVRTMMGRYRRLPDAADLQEGSAASKAAVGHALRAAINTPIQGSAADVVMMAMIKLWKSEKLRSLGWKLLLQIHDEVILEGPRSCVADAMAEVRHCMENPFDHEGLHPLRVHLDVDAKTADTWYKAK